MSEQPNDLHRATALTGDEPFATRIETGIQTGTAIGYTIESDAPSEHGGQGRGPSPVDLLTAALASCKSMTASMYAKRKGWPVESVAFDVRHIKRDAGDGRQRDAFVCVMRVVGDIDADQRQRMLEIAGRCPVHLMLANETSVEASLASE